MRRPPRLYRVVARAARPFVRIAFRPLVAGIDRVPDGGIVLAGNHLSGFDTVALAMPLYPRWLRTMGKNELFENSVAAWVFTRLGVFPAHGEREGGSVQVAAEIARGGDVVVIMPEGARRRSDRVHRPHTGAARTARAAGVPLVPAAIRGTDEKRRLGRWHVAFGGPVPLDDLDDIESDEAAHTATERLWDAITALRAGIV